VGDEIDLRTAAKMLGVCDQTVRRYIQKGILRSRQERPGAHVQVSRQSVLDILTRMRAQANTLKPLPWRDE
jgi:excisionase family DNA binding protein